MVLDIFSEKNVKTVMGFIIGNYSLFVYLYFLKEQTTYISLLKSLNNLVLKHSITELVTAKKYDVIIHRLSMTCFCLYYRYTSEDVFVFSSTLLYTEIPTIFYILKEYSKEFTSLYNANYVLLYLTFFKFKIYDFYTIIHNHKEFGLIKHEYVNIAVVLIYMHYIVNLYWFLLMNKEIYRRLNPVINTITINHKICRYINLVNIPLTICMYSFNPCKRYIYDIVGVSILSLSSYQYNNVFYNKLSQGSLSDQEDLNNLLFETVCVHLRCFLSILTSYYHVKNLLLLLVVSGGFHMYSIFLSNMNVLQFFIQGNSAIFIKCHNIILAVPVLCDYFLIFMNSPNEIAIPYLLINIMSVLLILVKPFDHLNDIVFQTLLVGQTYYYCLSNLNSIYH